MRPINRISRSIPTNKFNTHSFSLPKSSSCFLSTATKSNQPIPTNDPQKTNPQQKDDEKSTLKYQIFRAAPKAASYRGTAFNPIPLSLRQHIMKSLPSLQRPNTSAMFQKEDEDEGSLLSRSFVCNPTQHKSTFIWLHDFGEKLKEVKLWFEMNHIPDMRIIVPQSHKLPVTVLDEYEDYAWYDMTAKEVSEEETEDIRGIQKSVNLIHELIEEECKSISNSRIILAGMGQGGALAIHAGLTFPKQLGGIVSFCGYVPLIEQYPGCISESNATTPLLVFQGTKDHRIELEFARKRFQLLKKSTKVPIQYQEENGLEHLLSSRYIIEMLNWSQDRFTK